MKKKLNHGSKLFHQNIPFLIPYYFTNMLICYDVLRCVKMKKACKYLIGQGFFYSIHEIYSNNQSLQLCKSRYNFEKIVLFQQNRYRYQNGDNKALINGTP